MEQNKGNVTENYYKRQEEIAAYLYKKMKTTSYSSISVSDICREVGISRRSFYHYFQDKDECMYHVVNLFLHQYMIRCSEIKIEGTDLERATALMEIWKSDFFREFFDVFEKNKLLSHYIVGAMRFTKEVEKYLSAPLIKNITSLDDDLLCAYLASDLALMSQWRRRGYDTPSVEMARKYLHVIQKV